MFCVFPLLASKVNYVIFPIHPQMCDLIIVAFSWNFPQIKSRHLLLNLLKILQVLNCRGEFTHFNVLLVSVIFVIFILYLSLITVLHLNCSWFSCVSVPLDASRARFIVNVEFECNGDLQRYLLISSVLHLGHIIIRWMSASLWFVTLSVIPSIKICPTWYLCYTVESPIIKRTGADNLQNLQSLPRFYTVSVIL